MAVPEQHRAGCGLEAGFSGIGCEVGGGGWGGWGGCVWVGGGVVGGLLGWSRAGGGVGGGGELVGRVLQVADII